MPNSTQTIFKLFTSKLRQQDTYNLLFKTTGLQINQQTVIVLDFCLNPNRKEIRHQNKVIDIIFYNSNRILRSIIDNDILLSTLLVLKTQSTSSMDCSPSAA